MNISEIFALFERQIVEYHKIDSVNEPSHNPYSEGLFEHVLWEKSYIDTVQWQFAYINRLFSINRGKVSNHAAFTLC